MCINFSPQVPVQPLLSYAVLPPNSLYHCEARILCCCVRCRHLLSVCSEYAEWSSRGYLFKGCHLRLRLSMFGDPSIPFRFCISLAVALLSSTLLMASVGAGAPRSWRVLLVVDIRCVDCLTNMCDHIP